MKIKEIITEESYQPPELEVGDKILKGKFKNSPAEIKGFKKDKHNQPVLKTNKGDVQLFKPRLTKLMKEQSVTEGIRPISKIDTEGLSLVDWYILHEHKLENTTLFESLDQTAIDYLDSLEHYSSPVKIGNFYVPVFLMLYSAPQNNVTYFGETELCKMISITTKNKIEIYNFVSNHGKESSWPHTRLSNITYSKLYLFDDVSKYNDFRSAIALKFNTSIPEATFK